MDLDLSLNKLETPTHRGRRQKNPLQTNKLPLAINPNGRYYHLLILHRGGELEIGNIFLHRAARIWDLGFGIWKSLESRYAPVGLMITVMMNEPLTDFPRRLRCGNKNKKQVGGGDGPGVSKGVSK